MPTVLGPGPFKYPVTLKDLSGHVIKDKKSVAGFVVPWGYYYYHYGNHRTREMATASLASCIAVICSFQRGKKVFFAHVSSDGETAHIVKAIERVDPSRDDAYTCIAVLGAKPNPKSSIERLNNILKAANYGFHIYQSAEGAVSYDSLSGELNFGSDTASKCILPFSVQGKAMMKGNHLPLDRLDDSLDLDSQ